MMLRSTLVLALLLLAGASSVSATPTPPPPAPIAVLDAGPGRSAWLEPKTGSVAVVLSGRVYSLTNTEESSLPVAWSLMLGPSTPKFSDATACAATATFAAPGTYVLELNTTSANARGSRVVVTVYPSNHTFGYTHETLTSAFSVNPSIEYDFTNADWSHVAPVPPPGVHPRVLFGPHDIPSLRRRLQTTGEGSRTLVGIRDELVKQLTGGVDSKGVFYGKANRSWAGWPAKPAFTGKSIGEIYDDLAAGDYTSLAALPMDPYGSRNGWQVAAAISYEGFRCIVDYYKYPSVEGTTLPPPTAVAKAAAALVTMAQKVTKDLQADGGSTLYQDTVMNLVYNEFLGHAYDFLASWMNEEQRATVRKALSIATAKGMFEISMDGLRPSSDTSNWVPMHLCQLMTNTLAIEGEAGYNPELYWRVAAAYERFMQDGLLRDGTSFEGMGHNNGQELQMLLMMAKRGSNLWASKTIRRHVSHFYLAVTEPWGFAHDQDGTGGGSNGAFT